MRVLAEPDLKEGLLRISQQISDTVSSSGASGVVVGVSGGIDSAVVCSLCSKVVDTKALLLPEVGHSMGQDLRDSIELCESIGVPYDVIDIAPSAEAIESAYPDPIEEGSIAMINIRPRIRMVYLYLCSNSEHRLVAGTSNLTEILLGYCTKWGDGASDFLPIGELWKTEVFMAGKLLGIPRAIMEKKPSAGLYPGQTDEKELGADYSVLDEILYSYDVEKKGIEELSVQYGQDMVNSVITRVEANAHKRVMPRSLQAGL